MNVETLFELAVLKSSNSEEQTGGFELDDEEGRDSCDFPSARSPISSTRPLFTRCPVHTHCAKVGQAPGR